MKQCLTDCCKITALREAEGRPQESAGFLHLVLRFGRRFCAIDTFNQSSMIRAIKEIRPIYSSLNLN